VETKVPDFFEQTKSRHTAKGDGWTRRLEGTLYWWSNCLRAHFLQLRSHQSEWSLQFWSRVAQVQCAV